MNRKIFLQPRGKGFEERAVLNPTVYQDGNTLHIYYRASDKNNISSIGYAKAIVDDYGVNIVERLDQPLLSPEHDYECRGLEDPRITKIGDKFYLCYTTYDGKNCRVGYAISEDLKTFEKKGIISPNIHLKFAINLIKKNPNLKHYKKRWKLRYGGFFKKLFEPSKKRTSQYIWDKDFAFFPEKFNGRYALIHRLRPDIQLAYFDSFDDLKKNMYWVNHMSNLDRHMLLESRESHNEDYIGLGAAPLKTERGWLLIHHAVVKKFKRIYLASAALLDLKNPKKIIGRLDKPLFVPEEKWEKKGVINNTVFPEGLFTYKDKLYVLYGATDSVIGIINFNLNNLLDKLTNK